MAHLDTVSDEQLAGLDNVLAGAEAAMGFVPNSMLTMAHMPQLTMAFSMLAGVVFGGDLSAMVQQYQADIPAYDPEENLSPDQVQLIAYTVSLSAGCRYCQAHTSHNAHRFGIAEDKLQQVLRYEESEHFSESEKALITLALAAGRVPNESDEQHFVDLQIHFSPRQIVQIVGVISLFGYLNRWNDTLATRLEETPIAFAERVLAQGGWQVDKHGT